MRYLFKNLISIMLKKDHFYIRGHNLKHICGAKKVHLLKKKYPDI